MNSDKVVHNRARFVPRFPTTRNGRRSRSRLRAWPDLAGRRQWRPSSLVYLPPHSKWRRLLLFHATREDRSRSPGNRTPWLRWEANRNPPLRGSVATHPHGDRPPLERRDPEILI